MVLIVSMASCSDPTSLPPDGGRDLSADRMADDGALADTLPDTVTDSGPPPALASCGRGSVYYLSPSGDDAQDGRSAGAPFRTFARAFAVMAAGDELDLLEGTYSEAAGTGTIHWMGANSAQIPSGASADRPTCVVAASPGRVRIEGGLFVGRSTRKDSYIVIAGITFEGSSTLYNTGFVTVKNCGFHDTQNTSASVFGIGTNDHTMGNEDDLIEDCWVWGRNRIMAINYRSSRNVWRRVVVRGDGCDGPDCLGSGNPNVGISVYDSSEITLENVIVVDRVLDGGSPYADFAVAQHTPGAPFGQNRWLGTMSLGAPDIGYYFEPDEVSLSPAHYLENCVAWGAPSGGINLARMGTSSVKNCTVAVFGVGDGVRVAPELSASGTTVTNVVVLGTGRFGINSSTVPQYVNVSGTWESNYNQTSCATGCSTVDPLGGATAALLYPTRIERGSALAGAGEGGADIGANVVYRYGVDGTRHGETGFDTLTTTPLWPWPNEERIVAEMCATETRGLCSASSFTRYIWEYLGHPAPAEL